MNIIVILKYEYFDWIWDWTCLETNQPIACMKAVDIMESSRLLTLPQYERQ